MKEIERKFLVDGPVPDGLPAKPILQGYLTLATDSVEIRLRQKGDDYSLTIKSDGGLTREEREVAIEAAQFQSLWPATEGRRVEKTRHLGTLPGGQVFEFDVFSGHLAPLMPSGGSSMPSTKPSRAATCRAGSTISCREITLPMYDRDTA